MKATVIGAGPNVLPGIRYEQWIVAGYLCKIIGAGNVPRDGVFGMTGLTPNVNAPDALLIYPGLKVIIQYRLMA